jgi:signal transduction histidine kinase
MLEFSALVHELRDRISIIAISSQQLLLDPRRSEQDWLDRRLSGICSAASELQRIITAVRHLQGDAAPSRSGIDVSSMAAEIVAEYVDRRPCLARANITIQPDIWVAGNASEVQVLLDNLIGNALKFSSVSLKPEVKVTSSVESGRTVVSVTDNGVGIRLGDSERMFEPFTRCHPEFEGTGLGLAIVRRIVERHSGQVWAIGAPSVGTTISFFI